MYLVYLKVPNKIATVFGDGSVQACDYSVPEAYINPLYDIELYNEIKSGQNNGFATVDEAKSWANGMVEKVFKFIHSTPKVRKVYTKAYVKIVPEDGLVDEWDGRKRYVKDCFPRYEPVIDKSDTHITYDMTNFLVSGLKHVEIEETKKLYAEIGKKVKKDYPIDKFVYFFDEPAEPYNLVQQNKKNAKSIDRIPCKGTQELIDKLGLKNNYTFYWRSGPWYMVKKVEACTYFMSFGHKMYNYWGYEYLDVLEYDKHHAGIKKFLASTTTLDDIKLDSGDEHPIDLDKWMPFYPDMSEAVMKRVGEFYRFMRMIGEVGNLPDEFKK